MAYEKSTDPIDPYSVYRKIPYNLLPGPTTDPVLMSKILEAMRAPKAENGGIEAAMNDTIPAGFTYLGQFITHDISPSSDMKPEDRRFFTPRLQLDTLYGRGPGSDQLIYVTSKEDIPSSSPNIKRSDDNLRIFGDVLMRINSFTQNRTHDITREGEKAHGGASPKIGDIRNDRNYLVSQVYSIFLRFHNAIAEKLHREKPSLKGPKLFDATQAIVIQHYQWLILHQYLPMLVGEQLVKNLLNDEKQFRIFKPRQATANGNVKLMPEFSGAAFRIGHSQVREIYVFPNQTPQPFNRTTSRAIFLNSATDSLLDQKRSELMSMTRNLRSTMDGKFPYFSDLQKRNDLRGSIRRDSPELILDWSFFFDYGLNADVIPQASLAIDHHIASSLFDLFFFKDGREPSLPKRDYKSSNTLPSGYAIHLAYALANPKEEEFQQLLTTDPVTRNGITYEGVRQVMGIDELRVEDLSLGHYLLLEAEILCEGKRLGPLGSRILAEQIIWILLADKHSILHASKDASGAPGWKPDPVFTSWRAGKPLETPNTTPLTAEAQLFSIVDLLQFTESFHLNNQPI